MEDDGRTFQGTSEDIDREELIQTAIGDSVVEPILFRRKYYPRTDDGIGERLTGPIRRILRAVLGFKVLTRPLVDYLEPNEQPHFVFYSTDPIEVADGENTETFAPTHSRIRALAHRSFAVVTNERIIFLVGQKADDMRASCSYSDIETVFCNHEVGDPYLAVHADKRYTLRNCHPAAELQDAAEYINSLAVSVEYIYDEDSTGGVTEWQTAAGVYADDAVQTLRSNVDSEYVLRCGERGAKHGAVYGAKGVSVGFVLGAGYGIWNCLGDHTGGMTDAPNADNVATSVNDWRREAATSGNEPTEWIAMTLGAATTFASHSDDSFVARLLADVDPSAGAAALEEGASMIELGDVSQDQLPADLRSLASLSTNDVPESATELATITRQLFEDGLVTELADVSRTAKR